MITLAYHVYDSIDSIIDEINNGREERVVDVAPRFIFRQRTFKSVRDCIEYAKANDKGDYVRDESTSLYHNGPDVLPKPISRKRRVSGSGCKPKDSGLAHDQRTTSAPQRPYESPMGAPIGSESGVSYSVEAAEIRLQEHFGAPGGADKLTKEKLLRRQQKQRREYLRDKLEHGKRERLNDRIRQRIANREAGIMSDDLDDVTGQMAQAEVPIERGTESYCSIGIMLQSEALQVCRFARANWFSALRTKAPSGDNPIVDYLRKTNPSEVYEELLMPLSITPQAKKAIRAKAKRVQAATLRLYQENLDGMYSFDDDDTLPDGSIRLSANRRRVIDLMLRDDDHSTVSVREKYSFIVSQNPEGYINPEGFLAAIYKYAKESKAKMEGRTPRQF